MSLAGSARMSDSSSNASVNEGPQHPPDSPGSSVSSRMQEEYDELMKYAVIVPNFGGTGSSLRLNNDDHDEPRQSFPRPHPTSTTAQYHQQHTQQQIVQGQEEEHDDDDATVTDAGETGSVHESEQSEQSNYAAHSTQGRQSEDVSYNTGRPETTAPFNNIHHHQQQQSTPRGTTHSTPRSERERPAAPASGLRMQQPRDEFTDESVVSRQSVRTGTQASGTAFGTAMDSEITRFENLLTGWQLEMKEKIMNEYSLSKIKSIEAHRTILMKDKDRHEGEKRQLQDEMEEMKELLHTYEQAMERKDKVINNLSNALQKSKEKIQLATTFADWKLLHSDQKREDFASKLATSHSKRMLIRNCWNAWRGQVESGWKARVEKACQSKAQQVCLSLTGDYDARIRSLNEALDSARAEVQRLHEERDHYEENMKKAFMRGVCALNLEAMNMFHEDDSVQDGLPPGSVGGQGVRRGDGGGRDDRDDRPPYSGLAVGQEAVYTTEAPGAPPPRVVNAIPPRTTSQSVKGGCGRTKVTAKVTARTDSGMRRGPSSTLNPPMSSVVVERHPPVNKETMGQAMANLYPASQPVIVNRRIAGQGPVPLANTNIHNVKVVE